MTSILQPQPQQRARIVVADADHDTQLLYCEALRSEDVEIIAVHDGRDALVQCLLQQPALVITDTRLPFLDGFALCELLRQERSTRGVPIIVVTADVHPPELQRLRRISGLSLLTKPVDIGVLTAEVARLNEIASLATLPTEAPESGPNLVSPAGHQSPATRRFRRFSTTDPATAPPLLRCPACDCLLEFQKSRIGGVTLREAERWDEFACPQCSGEFEYRHRTRKLRGVR